MRIGCHYLFVWYENYILDYIDVNDFSVKSFKYQIPSLSIVFRTLKTERIRVNRLKNVSFSVS